MMLVMTSVKLSKKYRFLSCLYFMIYSFKKDNSPKNIPILYICIFCLSFIKKYVYGCIEIQQKKP